MIRSDAIAVRAGGRHRARVQHTLRLDDGSAPIVDWPAHAAAAPAPVGYDVAFDMDLDRVHFLGA